MEIFLGSHHFLLIMKHTPPPLVLPASAVLSIRKTENVAFFLRRREPCFSQTKDVTVTYFPLDSSAFPVVFLSPTGVIQVAFVSPMATLDPWIKCPEAG